MLQILRLLLKTKKKQTRLYFELNILVEPNLKIEATKVMSDEHFKAATCELTCGVGFLDIIKEEWLRLTKPAILIMPLRGGSIKNPLPIKQDEVIARRTGFKSIFGSARGGSEITVCVTPFLLLADRLRVRLFGIVCLQIGLCSHHSS